MAPLATWPGLVSTIIPVFNRAGLVREAVRSVLAQTYRPIEIIIVDDGSTDDTGRVVDLLAADNPKEIRVLHTSNGGVGTAREAGRCLARGEFIQYLDSDDLLLPAKFAVQVEALRAHPECGIAYGLTRLVDRQGVVLQAPFKWSAKRFDTLFPALLVDRWWNTHTPLFRRSVCDAAGAWSDMRMFEDWEYEARIGALGVRLVPTPQFLSDHRQHPGSRLTGGSSDLLHRQDVTRLLEALYQCSQRAGVNPDCGEMRHFSRWAFLESRRAGAAGFVREAERCLSLAVKTAGPGHNPVLGLYRALGSLLGWQFMGRLTLAMDLFLKRKPGRHTRSLSWTGGN